MYDVSIVFGYPVKRVVDERARAAFEEGAHQFLVTGGKTPSLEPGYESEAEIGYESLRTLGVPDSGIISEECAQSSIDNIIFSDQLLANAHEIGLVSSPRHLDRIQRIIRFCEGTGDIQNGREYHRIETSEVQSIPYTIAARAFTEYSLLKRRMGVRQTGRQNVFKPLVNRTLK